MPKQEHEFIPTRASLLSRLKNWDDHESWKDFFDTYWTMLYSVARRSGLAEAEAEDVVQETILAVARQMPGFHYDASLGSFKSWLMLIVRRRIIDALRKKGRQIQPQPETAAASADTHTNVVERIPDPAGDAFDRIYQEEWQEHIFHAALERVRREVSYEQFQMFDCYALKGWPVEEVARSLNTTVSAVYNAKHRITRLLKETVDRLERSMS